MYVRLFNDWLDHKFYKLSKSEIKSFSLGKLSLEAKEDGKKFVLGSLAETEEMNESKANQVINDVLNPSRTECHFQRDQRLFYHHHDVFCQYN